MKCWILKNKPVSFLVWPWIFVFSLFLFLNIIKFWNLKELKIFEWINYWFFLLEYFLLSSLYYGTDLFWQKSDFPYFCFCFAGLEALHILTGERPYDLRFDIVRYGDKAAWASYTNFSVGPEADFYRLAVSEESQGSFGKINQILWYDRWHNRKSVTNDLCYIEPGDKKMRKNENV